jgi:hypothetical protein
MLPIIELCEILTKQFNLCFFISTSVSFLVLTLLLYLLSCILHSFSENLNSEDFLLIIHACFTSSKACAAILNLAVFGKDHTVIYHVCACSIWLIFFMECNSIASQ